MKLKQKHQIRIRRMESKIARLEKILGIVYHKDVYGREIPTHVNGRTLVGKWWNFISKEGGIE